MADPSQCLPLTPGSISTAYSKIKPYIHKTPLLTSHSLSLIASSPDPSAYLSDSPPPFPSPAAPPADCPRFNLFFKAENFQKIGAFKARGAFHALTHLIETLGIDHVRRTGVITHSSGNHAQALALAAHTLGVPATIVMPAISTPSKIAGTRLYTDNVVFSGSTGAEREAVVADLIAKTGAILVPPYDHPDIILGQGTCALELESQHLEATTTGRPLDAVVAPIGGGGLLGGVATWFSDKRTRVFGAEPSFEGADDAARGIAQGRRIEHVATLTIADGLRTPVGVVNWGVVSDAGKVERVFSVSEDEIKMAMRLVLERLKVVVEPSGCVPLAVVLFNADFRKLVVDRQREESASAGTGTGVPTPWDLGVVFSGGNTTVQAISALFGEGGKK